MPIEEINELVAEFGKLIGIDELALDQEGYCCLSFDGHIINMEYDSAGDRVLLYANVGDVPDDNREQFYETLLDANLLWKMTSGATLGVAKEDGFVVLAYAFYPSSVSFVDFQNVLENFIKVTEFWKKRIAEFPSKMANENDAMNPEAGIKV